MEEKEMMDEKDVTATSMAVDEEPSTTTDVAHNTLDTNQIDPVDEEELVYRAEQREASKRMAIASIVFACIGFFIFNAGILNGIVVLIAFVLNVTSWNAYSFAHKRANILALILTIMAFW